MTVMMMIMSTLLSEHGYEIIMIGDDVHRNFYVPR